MNNVDFLRELEKDKKKNLEDIIRHALWEAEMVRKLGRRWFEIRDQWLWDSLEADKEMWRDPKIRGILLKAMRALRMD